jgi:nitrogen fixation/metabolism regulation signal transduction histidine kinase
VTDAIITLEQNGEIESLNPSAGALLKASYKELVGQNITRFFYGG